MSENYHELNGEHHAIHLTSCLEPQALLLKRREEPRSPATNQVLTHAARACLTLWPISKKFKNLFFEKSGGARRSRCAAAPPATLRVAGAPEGCRFAAARPNNVRQARAAAGHSGAAREGL